MSKIKVMIRNNQKQIKLPVGLRLLVRKCCQAVLVTEKFEHDAVGQVGNPICGDQMRMYIKVEDGKIKDLRWKTYGCASAIASTSALSELAKGKTLDEALRIDAKMIDDYLGNLPKHKFHCSILGHDALKAAIEEYRKKH